MKPHLFKLVTLGGLASATWLTASTLAVAAPITPIDLQILSGHAWRTTTDPGTGLAWTMPGYDDGAWLVATAPYPNQITMPGHILPGTNAQLMWNCNECPLDGASGPLQAFFRYDFTLDLATDVTATGTAAVIADDFFEMYVNGHFVTSAVLGNHLSPTTGQPIPVLVDFSQLLQPGLNVIALRACDFDCQSDLGHEYVFFDGRVQAGSPEPVVPEPGSLLLLATGIASFLATHHRRRRPSER